jgi:radical SAM protein with 4Fe4S-binding SPASM domain
MRPKRNALAIELTPYCNQKCGYCYNDWRGDKSEAQALSTEVLEGLLDRALTEVEFDHVTFTGGEPFARADVFRLFDMLQKHKTRALVISNGGLITDAIAERLAPYNPYFVQITLNGPDAALHEEHVGKGHFEPTLRGIRALRAKGVAVSGCIVVTRKNAHVVGDILRLFQSLDVNTVALSRFSPAGYASEQTAELLPSRTNMLEALRAANPFAEAGTDIQVTMPVPPCVIDTSEFPKIRFSSCPIGTEAQEFALGTDGKLRSCTLHADAIGDAKEASFAALVTDASLGHYRDVTPEFCAPCPAKSSCIGGCGAASAAAFEERGLDPFVAQHVDEAFATRLAETRAKGQDGTFVSLGRVKRRAEIGVAT